MEGWGATAGDKCLLHLLQTSHTARSTKEARNEAPLSITQGGIASALGMGRNNVPRMVARLTSKGLVEARRERVRGFRTRKTAYYLTYEGLTEAKKVRASLEALTIKVIGLSGAGFEAKLQDLPGHLGIKLSTLEILNHLEEGMFDSRRYLQARGREMGGGGVSGLPLPEHFYGRQELLEALTEALEGGGFRCVVVHGIAGVGKTTLVAAYLASAPGPVHYFRFRSWTTLRGLIQSIASFSLGLGATDLFFRLAQAPSPPLEEMLLACGRDLSKIGARLILDDFQNAGADVVGFVKGLLEIPPEFRAFRMAILSRELPAIYSRTRARVEEEIREVELGGLTREASYGLMDALGLPRTSFDETYRVTRGHPLLIELTAVAGSPRRGDIGSFVEEEVLSSLAPPELNLLRQASVYRRSAPLAALGSADLAPLNALAAKSLLKPSSDGGYEPHDLVREAILRAMPEEELRRRHASAATFCRRQGDASYRLEAVYHLLEAGQGEEGAAQLVGSQEELLRAGYRRELSVLLARMEIGRLPAPLASQALLLRGSLAILEGDWRLAEESLTQAEARARALGDDFTVARSLQALGDLAISRGQNREALQLLDGARRMAEESGDMAGLSAIHYLLGSAFERGSQYEKAREHFATALEMARELGNDLEAGRSWLAFGRMDSTLGDLEKAAGELEKAAEYVNRSGDLTLLAKVHISLGVSLCRLGKLKEGIGHHEESMRLAERTGDLRTLAYTLTNLGWAWYEAGDHGQSEALLGRALAIAEALGDRWSLPHIYLDLGVVMATVGNGDRAKLFLRESVRRFEQNADPYSSARALIVAGSSYVKLNMTHEAVTCFEEALRLAKAGGIGELEAKAQAMLKEHGPTQAVGPGPGPPIGQGLEST